MYFEVHAFIIKADNEKSARRQITKALAKVTMHNPGDASEVEIRDVTRKLEREHELFMIERTSAGGDA